MPEKVDALTVRLAPPHLEELDIIMSDQGLGSRSDALRWLLESVRRMRLLTEATRPKDSGYVRDSRRRPRRPRPRS